jgi:hypothetical protein
MSGGEEGEDLIMEPGAAVVWFVPLFVIPLIWPLMDG